MEEEGGGGGYFLLDHPTMFISLKKMSDENLNFAKSLANKKASS